MSTTTGPAPGRMQKFVDAGMRRLLRSPLHGLLSRKVMLLEVTGRRSGRHYVIPIAYGRCGDDVLMGVAKATWLRNLTPDRAVTVTVRGRRHDMYPELVTDEESVAELYPNIIAGNRAHARFQQLRVETDGSVNRDDLRSALARGLTLVRLRAA